MTTPTYKWAHPSEWLDDKINEHANSDRDPYMRLAEVVSIAKSLAGLLDGDQIQDLFQSEMEADGYFQAEGENDDDDSEVQS